MTLPLSEVTIDIARLRQALGPVLQPLPDIDPFSTLGMCAVPHAVGGRVGGPSSVTLGLESRSRWSCSSARNGAHPARVDRSVVSGTAHPGPAPERSCGPTSTRQHSGVAASLFPPRAFSDAMVNSVRYVLPPPPARRPGVRLAASSSSTSRTPSRLPHDEAV